MPPDTIDHTTLTELAEAGVVYSATAAKRPDRAAVMKDAHAMAAYVKWLKAEVQEAIDDTSPTVPHDEAMRRVRAALKLA